MKSPFPGMDPYLEDHWSDIHSRLVLYSADQVQPQLPRHLVARVEERVFVEPEEGEDRDIYPDILLENPAKESGGIALETELAVTEPVVVHYSEPETETFVQILEANSKNRLITVIEILSRSNKFPGEGQRQHRQKQLELKNSKVSLVEIDLLRSGKRVLNMPVSRIPRRARTTYQVCVRRGWKPSACEIYPVPLQKRLPILRIPLRPKDEDVRLDLQLVVEQAYRNGAYAGTINYREPPEPPLQGKDAEWADEMLRQAGKR